MRACGWLMCCLALMAGCEPPPTGSAPVTTPAASAPPAPSADAISLDGPGDGAASEPATDPSLDAIEEASEGGEREVADVGVGKQGRNYGGGVITEPIRQMFRAQQRIVFLNIQQNMRHFEALHDRKPESHEEFMEKIVKEANITLPELPAGQRYVYDPQRGELMVERPRP